LGCGSNRIEQWINIDLSDQADISWDLTFGIPINDASCQIIYNEHLLEHIPIDQAVEFLRECLRVLQPGGVVRIAMPSLSHLAQRYASPQWRDQDWLSWPEYQFIQTPAEMLNISFRWWGHQWLYDREELHRRLREAGFKVIKDVEWGDSSILELKNRETRKDSLLICEAYK
jgi:predicted SAM-dependent methyltransferase